MKVSVGRAGGSDEISDVSRKSPTRLRYSADATRPVTSFHNDCRRSVAGAKVRFREMNCLGCATAMGAKRPSGRVGIAEARVFPSCE
jgi:hypothetical protein